jgi:HAD superfamily phosphoserine phosphatase-like hydrolase
MGIRLVLFDLDGTLIRGDTCCELIAARIGRLEQMRQFERCVSQDEIAAARAEMACWYSKYTEDELTASLDGAVEAPGLRAGFERLRARGVTIAIASITWSFAVKRFARRLSAQFHLGTELREDGTIAHIWPQDKAEWMLMLAAQLGIPIVQTAAVGDSASDMPMLLAAGRSFYVGSEQPPIRIKHFPSGNIDAIVRELLRFE